MLHNLTCYPSGGKSFLLLSLNARGFQVERRAELCLTVSDPGAVSGTNDEMEGGGEGGRGGYCDAGKFRLDMREVASSTMFFD